MIKRKAKAFFISYEELEWILIALENQIELMERHKKEFKDEIAENKGLLADLRIERDNY